jgi:hypothetical protein
MTVAMLDVDGITVSQSVSLYTELSLLLQHWLSEFGHNRCMFKSV